jgi:ribonuclease HII
MVKRIAGVDEAGRGPLAGPVVAAACILPSEFDTKPLKDSKILTPTVRESLYQVITSSKAIWNIAVVDAETIDKINILQATLLAMKLAVEGLQEVPTLCQIDGNKVPQLNIPAVAIVRGDATIPVISAASILAKVYRDRLMEEYDLQWPQYQFKKHKGYGTKLHRELLSLHGPSPIHRRSFSGTES